MRLSIEELIMFKVHSDAWNALLILFTGLAIGAVLVDNISTVICLTLADRLLEEMNPLSRHFLDDLGVTMVMSVNTVASITLIGGLFFISVFNKPRKPWARMIMGGMIIIIIARATGAINNTIIAHGLLS
jgi:hypothetical protein